MIIDIIITSIDNAIVRTKSLLILILIFIPLNSISVVSSDNNSSFIVTSNVSSSQLPDNFPLVKILEYNILEAGVRTNWVEVIKREDADIILLVETGTEGVNPGGPLDTVFKEINADLPANKQYELASFEGVSNTDGQAIASRFPIKFSTSVPLLISDDGSEYKINHPILHAIIDINGFEVNVLVNHLTCCGGGLNPRIREQEAVMNYVDSLGDVPIIYGGDFNSDSPQDSNFRSESTLGAEPIDIMLNSSNPKTSLVHEFKDVFRTLNPHLPGFTFVDWQFQSRLDYIFVNQFLFDTMVESKVVTTYDEALFGSDHIPVYAILNFNADTIDYRPPLPVNNLNASMNATDLQIDMTWDKNSEVDLSEYIIYRNGTEIGRVTNSTNSYSDKTIINDTVYYYYVSASDINSNVGVKSLPVFIKSGFGKLYEPSPPIVEANSSEAGVELSWTVENDGGSPVLYYNIYRALKETDAYVYRFSTSSDSVVDTDLIAGIDVFYKVSAVNAISRGNIEVTINPSSDLIVDILGGITKSDAVSARRIKVDNPPVLNSSSTEQTNSDASINSVFSMFFVFIAIFRIVKTKKQNTTFI